MICFRILGRLQNGLGDSLCFALVFSWANALNLYSCDALSVHFDHREAEIAILEAFSSLRDEAQLVEDKTTHGRVSGVFGQSDVVLCVEVADVQGGVKYACAIRA